MIALDHGHLMGRIAEFHKQTKIQACRATADTNDIHGRISALRWTAPSRLCLPYTLSLNYIDNEKDAQDVEHPNVIED
jgi:hypothetical protein